MAVASEHGPLPRLLIVLTVVSGLVDSFSYLLLGHVFVANMTGNVVFFGFALAGVGEVSVVGTLCALSAFTVGAAIGGRVAQKRRPHRGRLLGTACLIQAVPVLAAAVLMVVEGHVRPIIRLVLIALLAAAMGGQNAVVRRLGVPDLTTTVMTRTFTGLIADASPPRTRVRRLLSVLAVMLGALIGGLLVRRLAISGPLWLVTALLVACSVAAFVAVRSPRSSVWR
ncbi:DUF1275 domain-containing protein [Streptosporangiaceae bacterium NEAU-GS5]|nr:DUF1275 domain-containing protein [Streptosporangiaceae bacterium NEAU-GS5]